MPVLYTARGQFAEYDALVAGLKRLGVATFISNEDLLSGNWQGSLDTLLSLPRTWSDVPTNGAEVAADILREYLS